MLDRHNQPLPRAHLRPALRVVSGTPIANPQLEHRGGINAPWRQANCTCVAGYHYYNNNTGLCLACIPGTYAPLGNQSACRNCVAGTYANASAQSACVDCEVRCIPPAAGAVAGAVD